jgi:hypothetical protein
MDCARQSPTSVAELVQHVSEMGVGDDGGRVGNSHRWPCRAPGYEIFLAQINTGWFEIRKLSFPLLLIRHLTRKQHLIFNFIAAYFSTTPLAVLMSFVLVPAHKRIVFVTGAELVWELFYGILVRAFAVRVIKTDFAQRYMRNVTEFAQNIEAGKEHMPETGNFLKYDEL